jgi:capsular exopolysaccharide synthesis family protein
MPWADTQRVVEEFRTVKRNVMTGWQSFGHLNGSNRSGRSVMITSSKPREGKTFTTLNLALSFAAEENVTVILIDADPVRGDVGRNLGIPAKPGLTAVLSGEVSLTDALIQTDLPNLIVLPSGEHGPHVPELLSGRGPSGIFDNLVRCYQDCVIVIDTAPALASTAPASLAPMVSQIVFVVEAGHTQRSEIESALHLLTGCSHISFLLNKAPPSNEHFGGYSYYNGPGDA